MYAQIRNKASRVGLSFLSILIALGLVYGLARLIQPAAPAAKAAPISVGLVTDTGGLDDRSFNWLSYQGLLRAQTGLGITPVVYTSTTAMDYRPNLEQCAQDGHALCIGVGFVMADAVFNTAETYTTTKFAIVDYGADAYPDNVRGISFASEEVAYLAGTLAGLLTESNVIGDIGGMDIPPVAAFTQGYRNGAVAANPDVTVLITYTNDFNDPDLGAQVAQQLIGQQADVIYAVAGPTGMGAVLTATQSGAWGIGVDTDFYETVYNNGAVSGANRLLSSTLKHADNAVYQTIQDVLSGTFTSGTKIYGLAENGVGLAPYHVTDTSIPQVVKNKIEKVRQGISNGFIDANSQQRSDFLFLPAIEK